MEGLGFRKDRGGAPQSVSEHLTKRLTLCADMEAGRGIHVPAEAAP